MYTLHHNDCFNVFPNIPDESIDLILCDLPYGVTGRNKWDSVLPLKALWDQYSRIIKPHGNVVLFCQGLFTVDLIQAKRNWYRYRIVYEKTLAVGFLNASKMPLNAHEDICVFIPRGVKREQSPTYNPQFTEGTPYQTKANGTSSNYRDFTRVSKTNDGYRYPRTVVKYANRPKNVKMVHPTQKPLELLDYLVRTYSNEGDIVLDNCMGSGSTGVSALRNNRDFIGIEQNKEYYEHAQQWIERTYQLYHPESVSF